MRYHYTSDEMRLSKEDSKGSLCIDVMTLVLISMTMLHEDGHDDDKSTQKKKIQS